MLSIHDHFIFFHFSIFGICTFSKKNYLFCLQAVARTVGPLLWGGVYSTNSALPFLIGAAFALIAAIVSAIVFVTNRRLPENILKRKKTPVETDATVDVELQEIDARIDQTPEEGKDGLIIALREEIRMLKARLEEYEAIPDSVDIGFDRALVVSDRIQ
jgi:hypothetical protein